jgi:hypothetical protein
MSANAYWLMMALIAWVGEASCKSKWEKVFFGVAGMIAIGAQLIGWRMP